MIRRFSTLTVLTASLFLAACQPADTGTQTGSSSSSGEGAFCGGIAAIPCPEGYACKLGGTYPDAGGTCVKR